MVFADPDREFIAAIGAKELPALVHLGLDRSVMGLAEGWNPETWRPIAHKLASMMSWSQPQIPVNGDPASYQGTPALP
jgi:hypothetical protein